jgi:Ca2+-binding EF-hand superfamily protein/6,7-dimethyl-8-ribityllumazine synthase
MVHSPKVANPSLTVGVIHAGCNVSKMTVAQCISHLSKAGIGVEVSEVSGTSQLPYGAQRAAGPGDCEVLICIGTLKGASATLANALAVSVYNGLQEVSLGASIPVIPGIIDAETPDTQVLGSQFANAAMKMAQLTGDMTVSDPLEPIVTPLDAAGDIAHNPAPAPQGIQELLDGFRESLKKRGARGIFGLARKFRIIDDDGSGELDLQEFKKAIAEHAMDWNDEDVESVFNYFDEDGGGTIGYDEFLLGVRGELNERRQQLVLMAFQVIDKDGSGILDMDDIKDVYDASKHPDVISGKRKEAAILKEFLDTFDQGDKDGKVTPDEFIRYYGNVSASIDDDDYFELMIRNAWHISGGEGWCANTTCRRVLVTHEDGSQTVEEIKDDIGMKADDKKAMMANLNNQGIKASSIDTTGNCDAETPQKTLSQAHKERPQTAPSSGRRGQGGGSSSIIFG